MQNISQQLKQNSLQSNDSMSLRRNNGNNGIDNDIIDVIIGSRKSQLALIQTQSIIKLLTDFYGNKYNFIIKTMNTTGDNIIDIPLSKIGEKALFTRELEEELIDNKIDFIVHSLKDLPTNLPNGCVIALITKREDPSDALVLKEGIKLENPMDILNSNDSITIGTSSLRRIAQLKQLNPNLTTVDIRGNLNTRISKLDNQNSCYSALILATAGLKRANYSSRISKRLLDNWYHAVGQGALAIECRLDDSFIIDLLRPLVDMKTTFECLAERAFLHELEGGCAVPIGVKSSCNSDLSLLSLDGIVLSLDGSTKVQDSITVDLNETVMAGVEHLTLSDYTGIVFNCQNNCQNDHILENKFKTSAMTGYKLAKNLLQSGAKQILQSIKQT